MDAYSSFPAEFEAVRPIYNVLVATAGMMWLINYIVTVRQIFRDRVRAIPLVSLCCNIAWEFTVVLVYRRPYLLFEIFCATWLLVNMVIVYGSVKVSMEKQRSSSLVHKHLPLIVPLAILGCISGYYALAKTIGTPKTIHGGGTFASFVMTVDCLCQLLQRGSTHGASWTMWLTRVLGSYAAIVGEFLKAGFWPQQWGWYDNALMRWCTGMAVTMDILYACIFWYMGQAEEAAKGRKA